MLSWGFDKFISRVSALKTGGEDEEKPKGRARTLLTLGRVNYVMKLLVQNVAMVEEVNEIQNKYVIVEEVVHEATGDSSLIRGDNNLLNQSESRSQSVLLVVISYLRYIHQNSKILFEIYRRQPNRSTASLIKADLRVIATCVTLCDILGSSRMFEDLLDQVTGEKVHAASNVLNSTIPRSFCPPRSIVDSGSVDSIVISRFQAIWQRFID
jgi:hypothetical protein